MRKLVKIGPFMNPKAKPIGPFAPKDKAPAHVVGLYVEKHKAPKRLRA